MKRREYQVEVLRKVADLQTEGKLRCFTMLWRRQGGKSTTLAEMAHLEMMRTPGRLVTYASASLLLGREIILKESQVLAKAIELLRRASDGSGGSDGSGRVRLEVTDREKGKALNLSVDDFAELFEAQRLEFRLYHSRSVFSRTQVIAPNPATARGWTGTVMLDEFGFIKDYRDLWEAVEPIVSTDPTFRFLQATTPPRDDSHYAYELCAPPVGLVFPVDARGNWYRSESGKWIHRVDIHDAYAAGCKLYDLDSGRELSPQEHFARADDKDAWRRNYGIQFVLGGTSACGLLQLDTAMRRGIGQCAFVVVEPRTGGSDLDFERALQFLQEKLGSGPVGLGWDLATTEKGAGNPSAMAVVEEAGLEYVARLIVLWKTKDPELARERARRVVECVAARKAGGRARRLCVDATNERYFATDVARELGPMVPVELVIGSESVQRPGQEEPMTMKQYLGGQLVAALDDNRLTLPPERYVKEDFRLVKKERGQFVCEPDANGRHGDSFDAVKLALKGLTAAAPGKFVVAGGEKRGRVLEWRRDRRVEG